LKGAAGPPLADSNFPGKTPGFKPNAAKSKRKNTMLLLVIAMGAPLFAVIGYALLNPNPPAPEGAD
jgi:hypothetical protein